MKHLIRRIASVVAVAVWATTLGLIAHSAVEAAPSAGWYWYTDDLDRDGRPNDMYVYWDSSGWRLDWWVYLDIDHNGVWDVAARDFNRDGRLDQVWFDFDQDRAWDAAADPHTTFFCTGLNQRDYHHARYEGFGQFWSHCSYTHTTITIPVRDPVQTLILLLAEITDSVA